jgi:hypothetical protein
VTLRAPEVINRKREKRCFGRGKSMHKDLENKIATSATLEVLQLRVSAEPLNCGKAIHSELISLIINGIKNLYFLRAVLLQRGGA